MPKRYLTGWKVANLKNKIILTTVMVLLIGIITVGIGTILLLKPALLDNIDSKLKAAISNPEIIINQKNTPPNRNNSSVNITREYILDSPNDYYYVALVDKNGKVIYDNYPFLQDDSKILPDISEYTLNSSLNNGEPNTVHSNGISSQWRVVSRVIPNIQNDSFSTLIIASSLKDIEKWTNQYLTAISIISILVLLLGTLVTRTIINKAFKPLKLVEKTAQSIARGDLSQRIPIIDSEDNEVGRLSSAINTMLRRIDTAFSDRAKTIQKMQRFISDASHELRTPLVTVRGYAELYRIGALQDEEDVSQAMNRIEKEAERMGNLVSDLLSLARLDEAKTMQLTNLDLVPLARDAVLDTQASSPNRAVSIIIHKSVEIIDSDINADDKPNNQDIYETEYSNNNTYTYEVTQFIDTVNLEENNNIFYKLKKMRRKSHNINVSNASNKINNESHTVNVQIRREDLLFPTYSKEKEPAIVKANEDKIRQVMTNLLGNAKRFTNDSSPLEIAVAVQKDKGFATFDIIDHGDGIPDSDKDHIFDRFWRSDTSRARETGGSGLGLAIVSSILKAHGGQVVILDTPGGGATFRVAIPLASNVEKADSIQ